MMAKVQLGHEARLAAITSDADRLVGVARGNERSPVPSCPGWTVDDLLAHLAVVLRQKTELTRRLRQPDPWPPEPPEDRASWLEQSALELVELFDRIGPQAESLTWPEVEPTVAVWCRRLAVETALHRRDIEEAVAEVTPIPAALALDGVDEMLRVVLGGDWSDDPQPGPDVSIGVRTDEHEWLVNLASTRVSIQADVGGQPQATVAGDPEALLLWLWGRNGPDPGIEGDQGAVNVFQTWLSLVR